MEGPNKVGKKKNVGIIGVEPMTNWGKIQQLVSNQWIILRENPPENFLGGFWGRCSLERHFVGTK
jgi:GDP-D-mannose dehydratase